MEQAAELHSTGSADPELPPPPTGPAIETIEAESQHDPDTQVDAALQKVAINKIEVLSNRLVPGSDGSIEHVVIGNNAVTVIRSTPLRGRVRVTKDNVLVGGVSCKILLTGLDARVDTVRHLVGGESPVHGALFLSKQSDTPVKMYGRRAVGSPKSVIQYLIEQHCSVPSAPNLKALSHELDGMFLPFEKLSQPAA
jgi:hypothetical protein